LRHKEEGEMPNGREAEAGGANAVDEGVGITVEGPTNARGPWTAGANAVEWSGAMAAASTRAKTEAENLMVL